jgi:hypothetical protein
MGRTIPSFRIAVGIEQVRWKPFRSALDKSDRRLFDSMFSCTRLYLAASTFVARPVPGHTVMISIAFHHQKRLEALKITREGA